MVIWWKKLMYSKVLKASAVIVFCIAVFVFMLSSIRYQILPDETSVYETDNFRQGLIDAAGYVRDWIVRYSTDDVLTTVTQEDIEAYKQAHGIETDDQEDKAKLIDEEVSHRILSERKAYFNTIQSTLLHKNVNVDFYAINTKTQQVITNMMDKSQNSITELIDRKLYVIGDGHYILEKSPLMVFPEGIANDYQGRGVTDRSRYANYYAGDGFEGEENYRIYVAVKDEVIPGDSFYKWGQDFKARIALKPLIYSGWLGSAILGIILCIYWLISVGRTYSSKEISMNAFDRFSLELQLIFWLISAYIVFVLTRQLAWEIPDLDWFLIYMDKSQNLFAAVMGYGTFFVLMSIITCVSLLVISSFIKHIKNKSIKEYIGIIRYSKKLMQKLSAEKYIMLGLVTFLIINAGATGLAVMIGVQTESEGLFVVAVAVWNIVLGVFIYHLITDYRVILQGAKNISDGHLGAKIQQNHSLSIFKELADNINTMGTGLEKAVLESVKSERLKTELITNVSHDLKTPLTSIISYIDLLKQEEINNATAKEYIGILDERSTRLKYLVEDLVEASKAVTGNVEAKLEALMLDELVLQALGEYTDRIEAQGVEIIRYKIEAVKVLADGRHMWRVIENLLSNVCKYSMPHTRAYVEVVKKKDYGAFVIKNVSKDALNIDPKELTERFVRGDASRTTEGSGLGLAIAQSLVKLQGGLMNISIDGDLFKVEIEIPLVTEMPISLVKNEK